MVCLVKRVGGVAMRSPLGAIRMLSPVGLSTRLQGPVTGYLYVRLSW